MTLDVLTRALRALSGPLAALALAALALPGCAPSMAGPAGGTAVVDSYYFFLKAQYDELHRRDESAVKSLERAAAATGNSFYLEFEAAKLLGRLGRVDEATARIRRALELNPADADARLFAAWLAAATGQWAEAETHYLEVLKTNPQNEEALSYLGALYAESGRLPEARRAFTELGASAPTSYLPDYYLGVLAQKRGENAEAIGHFQASLKKKPDFVSALNELALIYEHEGRLADAETTYRRLIRLRPEAAVPKARLSRILLKSGRREEAVRLLRDIGETAPDSIHAGLMVGLAYLEEGMLAEAEAEFEQVGRQFPDNDQVLYLLASVKAERKDSAAAQELLQKIRPDSQQFVDSRLFLASLMIEGGQRDQALEMLTKARSQAAWAPQLVLAQATMHEEAKRFKEARQIYLDSLKSFPDVAEIRFRLGFVEDKLGDTQACVKAMRKAVELDPDHADALNYLAYTWAERRENLNEALAMALRADQLKPENGYIVDTVAWIYYAMGDLRKSIPLLERAVTLSNEDPVILEHLGDALAGLGRLAEARRAYGKAVERGHESPGAINEKIEKIAD
jgi:tetratricopeptide (TPR) repeat protein